MNFFKHILTVNLDDPVDTYPNENAVEEMKENRTSHEDAPSVAHKPEPIFEPIQHNTISALLEDIPIAPPVPLMTLEPEREITPPPAPAKPAFVPEEVVENVETIKMQVSHVDTPPVAEKPAPILEPIQHNTISTPLEYVPLVPLEVCESKKETITSPLVRDGIAGIVRPPAKPIFVPEKVVENVENVEVKGAPVVRDYVCAPGMHGVAQDNRAPKLDFRSERDVQIAKNRVVLGARDSGKSPETDKGSQPVYLKKRASM